MPRIMDVDKVSVNIVKAPSKHHDGIIVQASGHVPTTGWHDVRLEPFAYIAPPANGYWDFDFLATAPTGIVGQVVLPVHASIFVRKPPWLKGVRVHASSNYLDAPISGELEHVLLEGGDTPFPFKGITFAISGEGPPWPFPW